MTADKHPRPQTTAKGRARLRPTFRRDGTVTAGRTSGINNSAAMVVLTNDETVACWPDAGADRRDRVE